MGDRYSRILSAARYYSAIDNYIKYITDSSKRGSRVGSGKNRPTLVPLALMPFGIDLGDKLVPQSGTKATWENYKTSFAGRTSLIDPESPSEKLLPKIGGYRAPRVNIITGNKDNGVPTTSKVTGLKYLKYNTTSASLPFGKKAATDEVFTAFNDIKGKIGTGVLRVYLINEKL